MTNDTEATHIFYKRFRKAQNFLIDLLQNAPRACGELWEKCVRRASRLFGHPLVVDAVGARNEKNTSPLVDYF